MGFTLLVIIVNPHILLSVLKNGVKLHSILLSLPDFDPVTNTIKYFLKRTDGCFGFTKKGFYSFVSSFEEGGGKRFELIFATFCHFYQSQSHFD